MNTYNTLTIEHGPVTTVSLHRPQALHALNAEMLRELGQLLTALKGDSHIRCLVLRGSGDKAFAAGADIAAMKGMAGAEAAGFSALGHGVMQQLSDFPWPTLAAVHGFALGGGLELMLACDMAWGAQRAKFGLPEVTLGLIPGFGGTARLTRAIGVAAAKEWVFSGNVYPASEALRFGLIQRLIPDAEFWQEIERFSSILASRAPLALQAAKRCVQTSAGDLHSALALEQEQFSQLFDTHDGAEGLAAFLAKRPPAFQGK